ncbi:hypothetical protein [Bradyrhizobium sp. CB2312]|uniref:hypothetical protein n=1 Tax=Bradyrhizobium sp. CB2312 TaxID=3039155 RepID=UPI0024B263B8|nr:hypothetical protein [Bradyrhizobium sp. CB2312]WFU71236.1 hypothetical protein QA642_39405 [Bradyrhizobium sp. CB2312]
MNGNVHRTSITDPNLNCEISMFGGKIIIVGYALFEEEYAKPFIPRVVLVDWETQISRA